ncbi:MAG TPA: quinone oxidoreductase [Crinalium sp.]
MKAIQIKEPGGADVLQLRDVEDLATPSVGQAQVRLAVAGLNYVDVYRRNGTYLESLQLPFVLGQEGAGIVEAVGEEVETIKVGDRVAFCMILGSYAEAINIPADQLIPLPDDITFEQGAAFPLQGITAHYIVHDYVQLQPGKTILVHAAAGGVGLLVVQWAKHLGAQVIGTVSTKEKAEVVKKAGADAVILYTEQDFVTETKRLTAGRGADLILDGVGRTTFAGSLEAAAIQGTVVSYGWTSGLPEAVVPTALITRSLRIAGGTIANAITTREALLQRANDVMAGIREGWLTLHIDSVLPLQDAAKAHQRLESRASIGKILLRTAA